jgi:hypothetical protein
VTLSAISHTGVQVLRYQQSQLTVTLPLCALQDEPHVQAVLPDR